MKKLNANNKLIMKNFLSMYIISTKWKLIATANNSKKML